eukprot:EC791265.1.p1 GENE.EC791265.1~~EC791265.1.p1  ORF type:complete len:128 (+),score=16.58 EC791265.1:89-472(+)
MAEGGDAYQTESVKQGEEGSFFAYALNRRWGFVVFVNTLACAGLGLWGILESWAFDGVHNEENRFFTDEMMEKGIPRAIFVFRVLEPSRRFEIALWMAYYGLSVLMRVISGVVLCRLQCFLCESSMS